MNKISLLKYAFRGDITAEALNSEDEYIDTQSRLAELLVGKSQIPEELRALREEDITTRNFGGALGALLGASVAIPSALYTDASALKKGLGLVGLPLAGAALLSRSLNASTDPMQHRRSNYESLKRENEFSEDFRRKIRAAFESALAREDEMSAYYWPEKQ